MQEIPLCLLCNQLVEGSHALSRQVQFTFIHQGLRLEQGIIMVAKATSGPMQHSQTSIGEELEQDLLPHLINCSAKSIPEQTKESESRNRECKSIVQTLGSNCQSPEGSTSILWGSSMWICVSVQSDESLSAPCM